jgi:tetratricopeptide (TPR) repeat protein
MRKLLDRIQKTIEDFVEQRDDLVLVFSCSDEDAPLLLKIVQDVEQANSTDAFLLFADEFVEPEAYVSLAIDRLREQLQIANDWLAEQGRSPLPATPETLDDVRLSPIQRLGQAMTYARNLVPKEGGHRLIWAMFPQRIQDREAYAKLMSAFAPRQGLRPGMQRLRIIFRDQCGTEELSPELVNAPRFRFSNVDISPDALQQALREEVEDEELPDERRMSALLQYTLIDSAHGRRQEALTHLKLLLGYYQHTDNDVLHALVLAAIADIFYREKDIEKAIHWYECAVPVAIKSKSPVVFHSAVSNLADIAFERQEYERGEKLYDAADQLAGKMLYAEGMARARERRGLCQEHQHAYDRAVESWEDAAGVSRTTGMGARLKANLEHLSRGYRRLGMEDRLKPVLEELTTLDNQEASV